MNDTRIKIVEGYDSCKTGMSGEETANGVGLYNETTNTSEIFAITNLKPVDVSGGNMTELRFGPLRIGKRGNYSICVQTTSNTSTSGFTEGGVSGAGIVRVFRASFETTDCSQFISLNGSTVVPDDGETVTLKLTENQRIRAMAISGTPGGDTLPTLVNLETGSYRDVAQNFGEAVLISGILMREIKDTVGPGIDRVVVDFGYGTVDIFFSETIDVTPISRLNLSSMFAVNNTGDRKVSMFGGTVIAGPVIGEGVFDALSVTIKLKEYQRIAMTRISGVGGGDGGASKFDMEALAVYDYSGNPNVGIFDIEVTEIPDVVPPTLLSGEIDLNVGTLTIFASETLDTIPLETNVDMAKIRLQKTPGGLLRSPAPH